MVGHLKKEPGLYLKSTAAACKPILNILKSL